MGLLNRTQILAAQDLPRETVSCPEWGGDVIVKTMTAGEREAFEKSALGSDGKLTPGQIRARMAAATVVDESGAAVFTTADVEALNNKASPPLVRIFDVAQRLNGMGTKETAELAKNSGSGLISGSSSSSPSDSAEPSAS